MYNVTAASREAAADEPVAVRAERGDEHHNLAALNTSYHIVSAVSPPTISGTPASTVDLARSTTTSALYTCSMALTHDSTMKADVTPRRASCYLASANDMPFIYLAIRVVMLMA